MHSVHPVEMSLSALAHEVLRETLLELDLLLLQREHSLLQVIILNH